MHLLLRTLRFGKGVRCLSIAAPAEPHFRGVHVSVRPTNVAHVCQLELHRTTHRNALSREVVEEIETSLSLLREHPPPRLNSTLRGYARLLRRG